VSPILVLRARDSRRVNKVHQHHLHQEIYPSWSNHVDASVNKANKVLGLLKRTVGSKKREILVLFRSLMRPLLEYANWPLKAYNVEHQELPLGKNDMRCHMKRDANYWAGARFSGVLNRLYKTVCESNGLECRDYFEYRNNNTRSNSSLKLCNP